MNGQAFGMMLETQAQCLERLYGSAAAEAKAARASQEAAATVFTSAVTQLTTTLSNSLQQMADSNLKQQESNQAFMLKLLETARARPNERPHSRPEYYVRRSPPAEP